MIQVEQFDLYKNRNILVWTILSFKSGLLNAAGFLFAGSYVTHVTGFGTQIGMAIGHKEINLSIELLSIPISFIFGSFLSTYILEKNFSDIEIPNYPKVQFLITFVLGLSIFLSQGEKFILIPLLCLVSGMKNALTTWATQGKIRTTHITGLATDIGIHLPKLIFGKKWKTKFQESRKVNIVRTITLISFSLGSCFSAILIPIIGYKIFIILFLISFGLSIYSYFHRKNLILKVQ